MPELSGCSTAVCVVAVCAPAVGVPNRRPPSWIAVNTARPVNSVRTRTAGECQTADLVAVARELADGTASRAEQAGVELTLDVAAGPLQVPVARARLQTILANLLDNAVKFTPDGGAVTLTVRQEGDETLTLVSDTGVGIPAEEQRQVFERFHRARNVSAFPGNGLGLAIVKAAVERSGGRVSFASSPTGTTFRVSLPLA